MGRAVLVVWLLTGCSIVTVAGPSDRAPAYAPACRASTSAPLLDATAALAATTAAGVAAIDYHDCTSTNDHDHHCGLRAAAAATSLLAGLVLAVSAAYGFSTAHICRDQRVSRRARP